MKFSLYNLCLALLLTIPAIAYTQTNAVSGQPIQAQNYNSSTSQIGEIKQSILTISQFQSLNGDCWKLMNGSIITGTDLHALTAMTQLPDLTIKGSFLRQAAGGRILGSAQSESLANHTHDMSGAYGMHAHTGSGDYAMRQKSVPGWVSNLQQGADNGGAGATIYNGMELGGSTGATVSFSSGETRPENIAVNFFIKVNKTCNF